MSCTVKAETENLAYHFDKAGISEQVLTNYLKRAVTMSEFLTVNPFCNDGLQSDKSDDIRLIKNIDAKFIGRAIYRWGDEHAFNSPEFLGQAARLIKDVHRNDSEVIFQAAIFENVTHEVDQINIPNWVFIALNMPVEKRNFSYASMLNLKGKYVDHWEKGHSVPDITRYETQLWFTFLAGSYINIGCEALHLGQINLIGMEDAGLKFWVAWCGSIRKYAKKHARRNWVLLDAHSTEGGTLIDDKSLLDFNSYPLRIKEDINSPMQGVLEKGYLDSFYGRSKACETPTGWKCKALPYLVELDNFGVSAKPGIANLSSHYIWGYDEITWFYIQKEDYRKAWLKYANNWIQENDIAGHLQMPVTRIITLDNHIPVFKNFGNNKSSKCPDGMNLEETIKSIWYKQ
ncbi:hypothetical protein FA046_14465 [Pedobacter cryophilus]|uniref:Uncharacterized protein n=2 Tax=Pedobacter cryophilus TaxID=2571271 RepID=A0A4U1BUR5_9SPHI|nr:hypothetical protein FA046_14465 [Pedobacter cryophilus]